MKLKGILFGLLISVGFGAHAQKYGATPEDSIDCTRNLSLYSEFYKQKNYDDAKGPWLKAMETCPQSSKNLYIRGVNMYKKFFTKQTTRSGQKAIADTIFWIYDMRIENFGEEGKYLGRKGYDMMRYAPSRMDEAYELMNKSIEMEGENSSPSVLAGVYQAAYELYGKEQMTKEELLVLYQPLAEIIVANLNPEKGLGEKAVDQYKSAYEQIEKIFSVIASCEDLIALYQPQFEERKTDTTWLASVVATMAKRDCSDSDFFLEASVALYNERPSGVAALGIGIAMLKKERFGEAVKYCAEAADIAKENSVKTNAYKYAALSSLATKSYANAKSYALKWLSVEPGNGEAYMIIGDSYLYGSNSVGENACEQAFGYIAAIDKYKYAMSLDPSLSDKANRKIGQARAQFPKKSDCFFFGILDGQEVQIGGWIGETITVQTQE